MTFAVHFLGVKPKSEAILLQILLNPVYFVPPVTLISYHEKVIIYIANVKLLTEIRGLLTDL